MKNGRVKSNDVIGARLSGKKEGMPSGSEVSLEMLKNKQNMTDTELSSRYQD